MKEKYFIGEKFHFLRFLIFNKLILLHSVTGKMGTLYPNIHMQNQDYLELSP